MRTAALLAFLASPTLTAQSLACHDLLGIAPIAQELLAAFR